MRRPRGWRGLRRPRRVGAYSAALLVLNMQNRILWCSQGSEEICGWYPDELIGQPLIFLIPDRDHSAHEAALQVVVEGGNPTEVNKSIAVCSRGPDGQEFPVNLTLYPAGGDKLWLGILETR